MCMFSRPVLRVAGTSIFARASEPGHQMLAYKMTLAAREQLAMVLPLPVPPAPGEDAVRFIDLERYPRFFDDMAQGFTVPELLLEPSRGAPQSKRLLQVHDVGAFEASFVPTLADFERLDPRFRLPSAVWDRLPQYGDWGFAVFKLREVGGGGGLLKRLFGGGAPPDKTVHPMAFDFPTRTPSRLFFPTLHVHDGEVHGTAGFDHVLYCQGGGEGGGWERSRSAAAEFMDVARAAGLVDPGAPCFRKVMVGPHPNADQWLG